MLPKFAHVGFRDGKRQRRVNHKGSTQGKRETDVTGSHDNAGAVRPCSFHRSPADDVSKIAGIRHSQYIPSDA